MPSSCTTEEHDGKTSLSQAVHGSRSTPNTFRPHTLISHQKRLQGLACQAGAYDPFPGELERGALLVRVLACVRGCVRVCVCARVCVCVRVRVRLRLRVRVRVRV